MRCTSSGMGLSIDCIKLKKLRKSKEVGNLYLNKPNWYNSSNKVILLGQSYFSLLTHRPLLALLLR
ncbi:hypothetical protein C0J52_27505 [Blattella germanica]|nr:hypothetical protein C0J52_27505 [Blattella germanica]